MPSSKASSVSSTVPPSPSLSHHSFQGLRISVFDEDLYPRSPGRRPSHRETDYIKETVAALSSRSENTNAGVAEPGQTLRPRLESLDLPKDYVASQLHLIREQETATRHEVRKLRKAQEAHAVAVQANLEAFQAKVQEQLCTEFERAKVQRDDSSMRQSKELQGLKDLLGVQHSRSDCITPEAQYIQVLIDGDAFKIPRQYIQKGSEGGREVAQILYDLVEHHCKTPNVEVRIKVYASALALATHQEISPPERIYTFAEGFNNPSNSASTEYIDVGRGKEKADCKLEKDFDIHRRTRSCQKLILLGVGRDGGYTRLLQHPKIIQDERVLVMLEEGQMPCKEISDMVMRSQIRIEEVSPWRDARRNILVIPNADPPPCTSTTTSSRRSLDFVRPSRHLPRQSEWEQQFPAQDNHVNYRDMGERKHRSTSSMDSTSWRRDY